MSQRAGKAVPRAGKRFGSSAWQESWRGRDHLAVHEASFVRDCEHALYALRVEPLRTLSTSLGPVRTHISLRNERVGLAMVMQKGGLGDHLPWGERGRDIQAARDPSNDQGTMS